MVHDIYIKDYRKNGNKVTDIQESGRNELVKDVFFQ